ncbi:hypothetical protein VNI00_017978 [Paramarasmius palmivorus]|uniref:Uncharacterized protein n=1 Tax=Paramarasmius palmivorus TaxID=297713 RepID=A0AAW0B355_9AGAR
MVGPEFQTQARTDGKALSLSEDKMSMTFQENRIPIIMDHPHLLMPTSILNTDARYPRVLRAVPTMKDTFLGLPKNQVSPAVPEENINPTFLPDRFFFSFTPIITIRHPALVLPSYMRAAQMKAETGCFEDQILSDLEIMASLRWERMVFEAFRARNDGLAPIVVDGTKVVQEPQAQMERLCELLGIDGSQIQYTWEAGREASTVGSDLGLIGEPFLRNLTQSTGVVSEKRYEEPPDLAEEMQKWSEEWNAEIASAMEQMIHNRLADYEYLSQFSI